ncbi:HTH-type transcriptional regulator BsdA [Halobacillus andaensis]|uniref:HTH-type transcriptional regulator BsdA n=1 Tax=Halobacillus andaensis TaxID=1176239 RepID=A0A917EU69_HALAA|nr:LysR family transcriptional regulator [Halobacillus andaensis]MBP2003897.1 DNA-binding transcriptional LysR family regulator [Halobacillus andaensis]GGF14114.1 HTH-type transcriptional regulator BsdA [Halobacillus andaensis]
MDLKQLRYFRTVAEEQQVTKAAKRLHMAQPPLSQQIKLMEEELNLKLFDRQGRKLELTKAGEILFEKAGRLLTEFDETLIEVQETSEGMRGKMHIGSTKSCFSYLSTALNVFKTQHPNMTYQLREGDTYFLEECIKNREIELAIVRMPMQSEEFNMLRLPSEPYVLVAPESWNISSHGDAIEFEELRDVPLMLLHRISGRGQFELIVDEFRDHGVEPHITCECPDATMLLSLVARGVGATIVPESTLKAFAFHNMRSYRLSGAKIKAESAVIWQKDRYLTKASQRLIKTFEDQFCYV